MIDSSVLWLWGGSSSSSLLLILWWLYTTYHLYPHLASPFHHFMTLILTFRCIYLAATFLYFLIDNDESKQYFALLEAVTFTLYNSFLFMVFVVLSKGFMTLRHSFSREEFSRFTCALGGYYVVFGIYRMNVETLSLLYIAVTILTGLYSLYECYQSLKIAKNYLAQLRRHSLRDMHASALQKLDMLKYLTVICVLYFGSEVCNFVLMMLADSSSLFLRTVIYHAMEFLGVAALSILFRVRYLDRFFGIVDFFDWVEESDWRPAEMFQAHTSACSIVSESHPILVGLPCDASAHKFKFEHYEIGQLEQPLLSAQV